MFNCCRGVVPCCRVVARFTNKPVGAGSSGLSVSSPELPHRNRCRRYRKEDVIVTVAGQDVVEVGASQVFDIDQGVTFSVAIAYIVPDNLTSTRESESW